MFVYAHFYFSCPPLGRIPRRKDKKQPPRSPVKLIPGGTVFRPKQNTPPWENSEVVTVVGVGVAFTLTAGSARYFRDPLLSLLKGVLLHGGKA